jgi:YVTN family beta-propeller protein
MPRTLRIVSVLGCAAVSLLAFQAESRSKSIGRHFDHFDGSVNIGFQLTDPTLGELSAPATKAPASLQGSTIAALKDGAVVIDGDSGKLLRTDRDGKVIAQLDIGDMASQLVVDAKRKRAFVADRAHDRIVVVDLANGGLENVDALRTKAEPFGLALAPDGKTLLVTTVADQSLTAFDTTTGDVKWNVELGPEPRGVAISPDGDQALVTFLTTGAVARVQLGSKPKVSFVSLDPAPPNPTAPQPGFEQAQQAHMTDGQLPQNKAKKATHNPDKGRGFARNAFAAAFVGHGIAVVPHQLSTPHLDSNEFEGVSSGYGGGNGFTSPVNHRLAFLDMPEQGSKDAVRMAMASTNLHQPRAVAYDAKSDTLYVAGYGSDDIVAVADVSQASVHLGWQHSLADQTTGCAPDGLAVDDGTGEVLAFCSLTRKVIRLSGDPDSTAAPKVVSTSGELAKSKMSASELRGKKLFRQGRSTMISTNGALACASCHPDNARTDGLTWFLQGNTLQTPLLLGRIHDDAAPFKWDGQDSDIRASLTNTVKRLGGTGISSKDAKDLEAFITSMPAPRAPTVDDAKAVARGKQLFESTTTGCLNCHDGPLSTDAKRHDIAPDLNAVDTPSLIGLANSAPYYHDGSATTLEAVLRNNGSIHSMGRTSRLTDAQISDLVAFLRTL